MRPSTFLLVVLALTLARLMSLALARTDLFFDESQYWAWSRDVAFGYYSKPPLIAWIIGAATNICGNGEGCIRAASPLFHAGTALLVAMAAARIYDRRVAMLAGLAFLTLPGVSFSATLISTDVPLLFFWALALNGWIALTRREQQGGIGWALLLGVALGFGLLAKYAMVYFLLGVAIHLAISRDARQALNPAHALLGLLVGLLILSPNLLWNLENGLATFRHTADNADWTGFTLHPGPAAEFFLAQFGVFGPILFAALLWVGVQAFRKPMAEPAKLLLAFSLPIVLLILAQGFASRAYANWAATAYPAATVLVVGWLVHNDGWRWLRASFAIHAFAALVLIVAPPLAPWLTLPGGGNPFERVLGWAEASEAIGAAASAGPYAQILTDARLPAAQLTYYLRDLDLPVTAWRASALPQSHYEQAAPFRPDLEPALYVTLRPKRQEVTERFAESQRLPDVMLDDGTGDPRPIALFRLGEPLPEATR